MKVFGLLAALYFSGFFPGFAQTPLSFVSATTGGSTYEVCYYDDYLFAGCANTFRVYDLTGSDDTPNNILWEERFISNIDQMLVNDGYLYICANHAGLFKYDVTNPAVPVLVAQYIPVDLSESIYDVAFYEDSLLVAAKNKLLVLDAGSLDLLSVYATYPGDSRIRGLDVKDSLLAYTVAYPLFFNPDAGVYLVDLTTMTELDFYQNTASAQCEVYFGQNTELLHVLGGSYSILNTDGTYFALNYSDPSNLFLAYDDTIHGLIALGSFAAPMSAFLINDTIYISTLGGGPFGYVFPAPGFYGQVYVYDATNASSIQYLTDIYAGLYHFDSDYNPANRKMYVASEWYGILTIDINDIYAEIDHGKTLTAGWCHGSAQRGDYLAEANEGYGMRLFNVSDRTNPILIDEDTTVGFCRAVAMDNAPDYIYGFFLTGKHFRVFEAATLDPVSDTTIEPMFTSIANFQNARYFNNRVAVIEEISLSANYRIVVMDVSDPFNPFVENKKQCNKAQQLEWLSDGNLLACSKDSLVVYDPATMVILDAYPNVAGQNFKAVAESDDTVFIFDSGTSDQISKFYYNATTDNLNFISSVVHPMVSNQRILMATDDTLLYIASSLDSLKALEILQPHNEVAVYNHGADHYLDAFWGVQDLYYNEGYLFLNEYMGQTTILRTAPFDDSGIDSEETSGLLIYPNPASHYVVADIPFSGYLSLCTMDGRKVLVEPVFKGEFTLDVNRLNAGIYLIELEGNSGTCKTRLVVE